MRARKNMPPHTQELDFEKLIFGETEKEKPKRPDKRWLILPVFLAVAVLAVLLWPGREEPETPELTVGANGIYGVLAPEMISWRVNDKFYSGLDYTRHVWFTPSLDPQQWGAERIEFHIRANAGEFTNISVSSYLLATFVGNGNTAVWRGTSVMDGDALQTGETVYVEFIARAGEHIVGFALAQILPSTGNMHLTQYTVEILGATAYPLVDGEFQQVTEDDVSQQIQALKEE